MNRMLKWCVAFVTSRTRELCQLTQVNWMLIWPYLRVVLRFCGGVVEYGVTNVAFVSDDVASFAYMLSVVTPETPGKVKVANIVRMSLPIYLHLGKGVRLKDPLDLSNAGADRTTLAGIQLRIVLLIKLVQPAANRP